MAMPVDVPVIDLMMGLPEGHKKDWYGFLRKGFMDEESKDMEFPAQYMFKEVPKDIDESADPITVVLRHRAEPSDALGVKLMLKWPNLYYSTRAFSPKYYPKTVIDFANTRGTNKVMYAGYFPMGLSLERIFKDMQDVPFRDHVWPKFLHENARRVFKL